MTEEFFRPEVVHLLVIISKGNWKTTWEGALGVFHMLTVPAPRIYAGASDMEQAKELFSFASHFSESEPAIAQHLLVRPSTREIRRRANANDILKILASDDSKQGGKKQGKNSTLGLLDEEHAYENDNLAVDLTSGGAKRRYAAKLAGDPLWWTIGKDCSITTAGHDIGGPLGLKRSKFLGDPVRGVPPIGSVEIGLRVLPDGSVEKHPDGRLTIARSPTGGSVMLEWACKYDAKDPENSDDLDDMAVVKLASPASTVTVESLEDAKEQLTPSQFKRYRACVWTVGYDSWLPETSWPNLLSANVPTVVHKTWEDDTWTGSTDDKGNADLTALTEGFEEYIASLYPPGTPIVGALDMARYRDTAAVVVIGRPPVSCPMCHGEPDPDAVGDCTVCEGVGTVPGKKVPRTIVWRSGGHAKPIRYEWPKAAILALHKAYNLRAFGADSKYADQIIEEMQSLHGVPMEQFSQASEVMGPADTELRKEILSGEFEHDGDAILTAHIQAGKAEDLGPLLLRVVTQKVANPPPIDACKAFSMANALEKTAEDDGEPLGGWG